MMTIVTAVLSGLLGGIVGAYIQRRTQHRMWLLQQRGQAFASFLQAFEKSQNRATEIISNTPNYNWQNYDHRSEINRAYEPTRMNEKVVRLFLSIDRREPFSDLVNVAVAIQGMPIRDDGGLRKFNEVVNTIQGILEDELSNPKWVNMSVIDRIINRMSRSICHPTN